MHGPDTVTRASARARRTAFLYAVFVATALLAVACSGPSGGGEAPVDWVALEPGGAVEGPAGIRLVAPDGVLDETVDVELTSAPRPSLALDDGETAVGSAVRIRARTPTGTASREPMRLELPLPGGLDDASAGLAIYTSGAETANHIGSGPSNTTAYWDTVEVETDAAGQVALLGLSFLSDEPIFVQFVNGGGYPVEEGLETQSHGDGFRVVCKNKDQDICDRFGGQALTAFADAHARFSGMGFGEPLVRTAWNGEYKVYLKPYKIKDNNKTCSVDADLSGRFTARYNFPLRKITICVGGVDAADLDSGDPTWTAGRTRVAAHELFHAVQYGYLFVRFAPLQMWSLEGTSELSMTSTDTFIERSGLNPRPVDVPLDDNFIVDPGNANSNQYRTQDFFAYLGEVLAPGEGLAFLTEFLARGPTPPAVNATIESYGHPTLGNLSEAYWAWVRNQTFEKTVLSRSFGDPDHPAGPACDLLPNVAAPHTIVLTDGTSEASYAGTLKPLTSAVIEIRITASGPLDEEFVYVTSLDGSGLEASMYDPADCANPDPGANGLFQVPAGTSATRYVLVANTEFRQGRSRDFAFSLTRGQVEPGVAIVSPADGATATEGETFTLRAEGVDGILPDDALLQWTYERWDGVPFTIATERADTPVQTPVLCDRTVPIQVEVLDGPAAMVGATDAIDVIIEDADPREPPCDWSIAITWPPDGSTLPAGETVLLRSVFDDDHPETDERLDDIGWWYAATGGAFIAPIIILDLGPYDADRFMTFDEAGTYRIGVTYGDASDTVDVVVDVGSPPSVTMNSPPETASYQYDQDGDLCAQGYCVDVSIDATATDDEDGALSGTAVVWSLEDPKGSGDWSEVATGTTGVITLPFDSPNKSVHLRVRATDSAGMTGEDFATLTLIGPPN